MVREVIWELQTQKIILQWNQVHVDLRYFVLLEQIVLKEELIALDCSPGHKQDVDLLVVSFLPVLFLVNYLVYRVNIGPHHENYGLLLGLHHVLVSQYPFLLHV